jgi:hypothetical protein
MGHRTDTANARGDDWHLGVEAAFTELFETPEFINMKLSVGNPALVIQEK